MTQGKAPTLDYARPHQRPSRVRNVIRRVSFVLSLACFGVLVIGLIIEVIGMGDLFEDWLGNDILGSSDASDLLLNIP